MKQGDIVRIKPTLLDGLLVSARKLVEGRVGRVASVYTPYGGQKRMVSIYWRHKNGNERKYPDSWPIECVESAE